MSSFSDRHRTHSWPPPLHQRSSSSSSATQARPKPKKHTAHPEVDDASLSHFIIPVTEEDDPDDFLSLSAGIIPSSTDSSNKGASFRDRVQRRWDRYVKHQGASGLAPPAWNYETATEEQQVEMATTALSAVRVPVIIVEPTRGRAQEILANNREHRASRKLVRHSHSWKEPSVHLFTVLETDENETANQQQYVDKDERPSLKKKHDSGFLEGSWDGMDETPLLQWD